MLRTFHAPPEIGISIPNTDSFKFCGAAKIARLYSDHASYVAAVERITKENLKAGYITASDAEQTIREAKASKVGQSNSNKTLTH